jgi:hypothetical protein
VNGDGDGVAVALAPLPPATAAPDDDDIGSAETNQGKYAENSRNIFSLKFVFIYIKIVPPVLLWMSTVPFPVTPRARLATVWPAARTPAAGVSAVTNA